MSDKIELTKKVGNFISNILLGETKEKIVRTDEAVRRIDNNINDIKGDCKSIWAILSKHGEDIKGLMVYTKYGYSNSPTTPNELGQQLLKKSGFTEIYPELKQEIFGLMDSWNLRTLYDYEKGAEKALNQLKDNPLMDKLKNHSVNNAHEPLELIFSIASWIIRDDYNLYKQEHKNT